MTRSKKSPPRSTAGRTDGAGGSSTTKVDDHGAVRQATDSRIPPILVVDDALTYILDLLKRAGVDAVATTTPRLAPTSVDPMDPARLPKPKRSRRPPAPITSAMDFLYWSGGAWVPRPRERGGGVDRSATLYVIARGLVKAGLVKRRTIARALAERDVSLEFYKYAGRADAARRYSEIAAKVVAERP